MNTEMVDPMLVRIAKAIASSEGSGDWQAYLSAARASLEVLREPSPAMLEAATHGLPDYGDLPEDWRAMIDHVLGKQAEINDNLPTKPLNRVAS
ncbi:MAG: hypothetical protein KGO94_12145 [Alphaproteobacteria bacterium]|nr:hypothetical protein [Alphaproteobacteria bacterium]